MYFPNCKMLICLRRKVSRILHSHWLHYLLVVAVLIFLLHPERNARSYYEHLPRDKILQSLVPLVSRNLSADNLLDCDYSALITDKALVGDYFSPGDALPNIVKVHRIKDGGEYTPSHCKPKFSTAVIVPYRDRPQQLQDFIRYMHNYLRAQNIHYRIYVIEQLNYKAFNRAKLLNIGAVHAIRDGFPCLVLHDVDLLPLHQGNLYACTQLPRHMSSSINKFRYTLPYLSLFGGAVAILASQFKAVNGMSNKYFGWGAEDDDLSQRIEANGLSLCRFDPEISRYHMVNHRAQTKGQKNKQLLSQAGDRMAADGLNSLEYSEVGTAIHPLFTHVMVDF